MPSVGLANCTVELANALARALHRRHLIDQVEYRRMCSKQLRIEHTRVNDGLELSEDSVMTSWVAEGTTRSYWNLIAREAIRFLNGDEQTELPAPLVCPQCRGIGTLLIRPEGVPAGVAKVTNQLRRETCAMCKGTGEPPKKEDETQ